MAREAVQTSETHAEATISRNVWRMWPLFFAALLGISIIYGVGFANSSALHNAAHDSRHSLAFPCH